MSEAGPLEQARLAEKSAGLQENSIPGWGAIFLMALLLLFPGCTVPQVTDNGALISS